MYSIQFTVEGCGDFPVDMLRYDCCFPATSDDAIQLTPRDLASRRSVTLKKFVRYANSVPTEGRWKSFGWTVTSVEKAVKL